MQVRFESVVFVQKEFFYFDFNFDFYLFIK
jgi:hypothetical protein